MKFLWYRRSSLGRFWDTHIECSRCGKELPVTSFWKAALVLSVGEGRHKSWLPGATGYLAVYRFCDKCMDLLLRSDYFEDPIEWKRVMSHEWHYRQRARAQILDQANSELLPPG